MILLLLLLLMIMMMISGQYRTEEVGNSTFLPLSPLLPLTSLFLLPLSNPLIHSRPSPPLRSRLLKYALVVTLWTFYSVL